MKTVTLKIEQKDEEKKLKEIESDILCAFDDVRHGRTKKIRSIA